MEPDLEYCRRRSGEEAIAARKSGGAARVAHKELARLYEDRVALLEDATASPSEQGKFCTNQKPSIAVKA
jgi:hypothetical protein